MTASLLFPLVVVLPWLTPLSRVGAVALFPVAAIAMQRNQVVPRIRHTSQIPTDLVLSVVIQGEQ
jgi:hypothetical protein